MTPFSRRSLLGTAGLTVAAQAVAADQPPALLGAVSGDRVTLPNLFNKSEAEAPPPNPDPAQRRLGVAVVGLGHL